MGTVYFKNTSSVDDSPGVTFVTSASITGITPGGTPNITKVGGASNFVGETFNITGNSGTFAAHNNANTSDTPDATWTITVGAPATAGGAS